MKTQYLLLIALLATGCATSRHGTSVPPARVMRDEQDRVIERIDFHDGGSIRQTSHFKYISDTLTIQKTTAPHPDGGWTETETYHLLDTGISLSKQCEFDIHGKMKEEQNSLIQPGSHKTKPNIW